MCVLLEICCLLSEHLFIRTPLESCLHWMILRGIFRTVFAKSFMLDDRILNTLLKCQLTIKYCTVFRNCILSTFSSCLACEPVVMLLSHLLLVYNQFNYKNLIWIFRNIWELRVKSTISYFFKATNSLLGKCVKYVQR